ncbi:hypothetical protein [Bordetella bronchiseptica]|uniref:hypothetical protein n=1 Tax=Bordetella bronchiseptica TaxID=518 RepID=UPI001FB1512C|nr:hypothetical protein [Bordetella bronchiseptica]
MSAWGVLDRACGAWRNWGEYLFVVLGSLWIAHHLLCTVNAYEHVRLFLSDLESYQLDELILLAALACPAFVLGMWIQSRRLARETQRRLASDTLTVKLLLNLKSKRHSEA